MITECRVQVTVYQCLPEGGAVAVLQTFTDEDVRTSTSFVFNQLYYVVCNRKTAFICKLKESAYGIEILLDKRIQFEGASQDQGLGFWVDSEFV